LTADKLSVSIFFLKFGGKMITETMVLVALRQKNWKQASVMAGDLYETKKVSLMKNISLAATDAESDSKAGWLLTVWSELRWEEINEDEEMR
jgi:hypothetical protein